MDLGASAGNRVGFSLETERDILLLDPKRDRGFSLEPKCDVFSLEPNREGVTAAPRVSPNTLAVPPLVALKRDFLALEVPLGTESAGASVFEASGLNSDAGFTDESLEKKKPKPFDPCEFEANVGSADSVEPVSLTVFLGALLLWYILLYPAT